MGKISFSFTCKESLILVRGYLHYDTVKMKHSSCMQRNEGYTTVIYYLGWRPFYAQCPFRIWPSELQWWVRRRVSQPFPIAESLSRWCQKSSNEAWQPLGVDMVESGFPSSKAKNAPSDYLGASSTTRCYMKGMFQIYGGLLKSGYILCALHDQVYEEDIAQWFEEVGGCSFYVKVK